MTSRLAVYDINQYLWEQTTLSSIITVQPPVTIPFFPVRQEPESVRHAHIVYTSRTIPSDVLWQTTTDEILYRVYAPSMNECVVISNEIVRSLRKFDESAEQINGYLDREGRTDFRFLYTKVNAHNSPNPLPSEDGLWARPIWIRAFYVENQY